MRQASSSIVSRIGHPLRAAVVAIFATALLVAEATSAAAAPHSAIVIDANTGKTLYASDANARRYPASLTKMMTLYMTFEALTEGRISKSTKVTFSANAAAEPPTKLGVKKGGSITVETAILSMVTKSANDSATAMGEYLGGSEEKFARMMTAKARDLGMKSTVFRNANGLPNTGQFTTAHDMAILGIALREHFPQYYDYFSVRSFKYGNRRINGHNRLLGRIKGVDGIKTGYTRASGFNLATSVADGGRHIVGVVMGGKSGRSRDNEMAHLVKKYLPKASTRGGGDLIAKSGTNWPAATLAKMFLPKHDAPIPDNRPADTELAAAPDNLQPLVDSPTPPAVVPVTELAQAYAEPERPAAIDPVSTASVPSGWVVQVASSPKQSEAQAFLAKTTRQAPAVLADASGFTVAFHMNGVTYYRARFGGFGSKNAARGACKALKKKKIECYAVQQ